MAAMEPDGDFIPLDIRLFGTLEVRVQGSPLPPLRFRKARWLLALLVLHRGRPVEREWLAGTLWPESPESQALYSLRRRLVELRQALGEEASRLRAPTPRTLCFDLEGASADVIAFDAAVDRGDAASLNEAVSLYCGPLLEDCGETWSVPERETREQAYLSALETLAAQAQEEQNYREAGCLLRQVILTDPLRESAQRALMNALALCGDPAAAFQVYRDLRALLRAQFNVEPDGDTIAAYERIRRRSQRGAEQPRQQPAQDSHLAWTAHIPNPITRLIGRESELRKIASRIRASRLVTLTGMGGVGKTRLAIQAAQELSPNYADSACFVELAPLADHRFMTKVVAEALGIPDDGLKPIGKKLFAALQTADMLLVLDNCEHLLDSCAALAHPLLEACPGLRILATSREPLGITGEVVWRVPPLPVPPPEDDPDPADPLPLAMRFAAVALFSERANQVDSTFELTAENADDVSRICRRLDGIPLALEMAAARVRAMSPAEIADRLDDRFELLTHGSRSAMPRHQTLRAMIDWSYLLLSQAEQALFQRLSVFSGGWTEESAKSVCAGEGVQEIPNLLDSLTRKSLIVFENSEGGGRYHYLETVREYAWERLEEGHAERLRECHLTHFLALAEEAEPHLWTGAQLDWIERLEAEYANLRAALEWAVLHGGDQDRGLRLIGALAHFWWLHSHYSEGRTWLDVAMQRRNRLEPSARARVLHYAAAFELVRAEYDRVREWTAEARGLYRAEGDPRGEAFALVLHAADDYNENRPRARQLWSEAVQLARVSGDTWIQGFTLSHAAYAESDDDRCFALFAEVLQFARSVGERWSLADSLLKLGNCHLARKDVARAEAAYEEALSLAAEVGEQRTVSFVKRNLAEVALVRGDTEIARRLHNEATDTEGSIGLQQYTRYYPLPADGV